MKPVFVVAALSLCAVLFSNVTTTKVLVAEMPQAQVQKLEEASIELRNIKPSIMAYWLDPAHNSLESTKLRACPLQVEPEIAVLPAGVERLIAEDSTNTLIVRGTLDGVAKARQVIARMDVPIPLVKIDAQWLRLPKSVVLAGKLTNRSSNAEVEAFDGQAVLDLVATKKATIVNAPTITTFNKMLAQTVSMMTMSVAVPAPNGDKTRALTLYVGQGIFSSMMPTFTRAGDIELKIDFLDGFILDDKDHALGYAKRVDYRPIPSDQNRTIQTAITFSHDEKKFVALRNLKQNDAQDQFVLLVRATPHNDYQPDAQR